MTTEQATIQIEPVNATTMTNNNNNDVPEKNTESKLDELKLSGQQDEKLKKKSKGKGKKSRSQSSRSGLKFPVGRVGRLLRRSKVATRVGKGAGIYLAAVLEYLTVELMEISGTVAKEKNRHRITPQHLQMAVSRDSELSKIFAGVMIPSGGYAPSGMTADAISFLEKSNNKNKKKKSIKKTISEEEKTNKPTEKEEILLAPDIVKVN